MNLATHQARILRCFELAQHSPDPSTKVGAKLYDEEGYLLEVAWNSFPASSHVGLEYYQNRELKYTRMIHAEMRCIINAGNGARDGVLYTSMIPCKDCAKHIAEARIVRVYYPASCMHSDFVRRQSASIHVGQLVLAESGVESIEVEGV